MPTEDAIADIDRVPYRREGLCCRSFDGEAVLYDPAHNTVHYLNRTAYFIWTHCDGQRCIEDIADALVATFDVGGEGEVPQADALDDIRQTLAELASNGLIDFSCRHGHDPAHHRCSL